MKSTLRARFERVRQVGAGAHGVVYLARDLETGQSVALKVLNRDTDLRRFQREAEALASLSHPAIVRYVAHGFDANDRAFLAMEWLEGENLADKLEHGVLSVGELAMLGTRVAGALGSALFANVVHRDLKPANLFLPHGDVAQAKVLDFGLARSMDRASSSLTGTGCQVGTPSYMSPEQAHGEKGLTFKSDVFSLGIVFYECLAGHLPFHERSAVATLMKICFAEPRPLESRRTGLPKALCSLVQRMLDKRPSARPSYDEVLSVLSSLTATGSCAPGAATGSELHIHSGAFPRMSLHARRELRVVSVLFLGESVLGGLQASARLSKVLAQFAARCERLPDGARVILADESVEPSDQAVSTAQCAAAIRALQPSAAMVLCTGLTSETGAQPGAELSERGRRLLEHAPPGATLVDASSARMIADRFEVHEREEGLHLIAERSCTFYPDGPRPSCTPFVGRSRELIQLEMLMQECVDEGVSHSVLITGPAGAGKSRLLRELHRRLGERSQAWVVLEGRSDSLGQAVRFGSLRHGLLDYAGIDSTDTAEDRRRKVLACVERHVAEGQSLETAEFLGEMLGVPFPDEGREVLRSARQDPQLMADWTLAAWLRFVEAICREHPLLLVMEDLHWADAASLRYLQAARKASAGRPLMWLALARPCVHETLPQLRKDRDLEEVRLLRLRPGPCHQMLEGLLAEDTSKGLRERLVALADGNPLFLEELARACRERPGRPDLPVTVLAVLQARLDRLDPDTKLVLRAACVFGRSFSKAGVSAVLGGHAPRVELDRQLQVLEEQTIIETRRSAGPDHYRFRHDLIGEAAYRLLTDADRAVGHSLVGAWLERQEQAPPALIAEHFDRAGEAQRAVPWYLRAVRQALEVDTTDEVVRLGQRCVECGASGSELGEVASLIAEASSWRGDGEATRQWAELARSTVGSDSPSWWRATQVSAINALRSHDPGAPALLEEMVEQSAHGPWSADRTVAVAYVACEAFERMGLAEGSRLLRLVATSPGETDLATSGRPEGVVQLADSFHHRSLGQTAAEIRAAQRAAESFRRVGAVRNLVDALSIGGLGLVEIGQAEQAERYLREARTLAERTGSSLHLYISDFGLAMSHRQRGENAHARALLSRAADELSKSDAGAFEAITRTQLALVEAATGQWDAAHAEASRAVALASGDARAMACALAASSHVHARTGQPDLAYEEAQRAVEIVRKHQLVSEVAAVWVAWLEVLVFRGERQAALDAAALVMGQLRRRAAELTSSGERKAFLEGVPEHRRLVELAEQLSA